MSTWFCQLPFSTTAIDARDTVCSLHLGIAEGLVEGTDVHVEEPSPALARAECRLRIRAGAPRTDGTGESAGSGRLTLQRPASRAPADRARSEAARG